MAVLAIDFDEVLHDSKHPKPGRTMGPPIEGAKEAMDLLRAQGHRLVIHTVRGGRPKHVEDWLDYYKIPFDVVTDIKVDAACYLDDKALKFTDWKKALDDIEAL